MSAPEEALILARLNKKLKHVGRHSCRKSAAYRRLLAENEGLLTENRVLQKERPRLKREAEFWYELFKHSVKGEEATDVLHLHKRYFLRDQEANELAGLLTLREARIAELEQELAKKDAHIKKLEVAMFNRKSEQGPLDKEDDAQATGQEMASCRSRKRGKQLGSPGFGPRHHDSLPVEEVKTYDMPESCCVDCGEQWQEISSRESDEVEVSVRAYRRKHCRKRYGHFCKTKNRWLTKTATGPKRLFPHSSYGISFWVFLLVGKFALQIPINRLRLLLEQKNLLVSQGTITAGFKRLHKLIAPLILEIKRYSREDKHHWHIDDTGWKVFIVSKDKAGFGWYLWVFRSDDVCVYILSPSRARAVPKGHLEHSCGVVTSDRLASNRKLSDHIKHSFCWVHERRELRQLAVSYPEIADVCKHFLKLIGNLFHWNAQRLLEDGDSAKQRQATQKLKDTLEELQKSCESYLSDTNLHTELKRVLNGIKKDWDGLSLFFDLPSIPPDNNAAERALRGPVVGRKNYYGCGSKWSAKLTADMFTLDATLKLNNVNTEQFLIEYLTACAENDSKPPPNAAAFLPWNQRSPPKTN